MRRAPVAAAVAASLLVPIVAVAASRGDRDRTPAAAPSFQRDVAPILREKCTGCHQVGGIAPFSLQTSKQATKWAQAIGAAVNAKLMPPWPPGPASPDYVGEETRQLTAQQRSTLVRWAKAGGKASGVVGKPPTAKTEVRSGERLLTLAMPATYMPKAKTGNTDDYRCFLLDPKLPEDAYATSASIRPGARSIVHHVILFRIPASAGAEANQLDAASAGAGWSCFGGIGVATGQQVLDSAPWIAAWAPGWGSGRLPDGTGVSLPKGSLVVMQVHYNLVNGSALDRSRAVFTLAPPAGLKALETVLLPAPVELACVKGEKGRLCNRDAAARRPRPQVRLTRRRDAGRAALLLREERREPEGDDDLHVRPHALAADDDPPGRGSHAPARQVDPRRAQPGHGGQQGAARHPGLGLPLAERVCAASNPSRRRRATPSA